MGGIRNSLVTCAIALEKAGQIGQGYLKNLQPNWEKWTWWACWLLSEERWKKYYSDCITPACCPVRTSSFIGFKVIYYTFRCSKIGYGLKMCVNNSRFHWNFLVTELCKHGSKPSPSFACPSRDCPSLCCSSLYCPSLSCPSSNCPSLSWPCCTQAIWAQEQLSQFTRSSTEGLIVREHKWTSCSMHSLVGYPFACIISVSSTVICVHAKKKNAWVTNLQLRIFWTLIEKISKQQWQPNQHTWFRLLIWLSYMQ